MKPQNSGMTLIELIVVIVIVGILASIAIPSYRDYVLRANRSEARAALLALATAQEKYYLECNSYVSSLDASQPNTCPPGGSLSFPATSERGYYTIAVTAADVNGWTATATPAGPPQAKDTKCSFFSLTSTGVKSGSPNLNGTGVTKETTETCWSK